MKIPLTLLLSQGRGYFQGSRSRRFLVATGDENIPHPNPLPEGEGIFRVVAHDDFSSPPGMKISLTPTLSQRERVFREKLVSCGRYRRQCFK
jgi:hypothetical protein